MPRARGHEAVVPLTPRVLLILWGLADGPQHGYRLLKIAERLGRDAVRIGPASLYESIQALESRGLIERSAAPPREKPADRRRRYFRLTDAGRRTLEAEARRVVRLADDLLATGIAPRGKAT